MNLYVIIAIIIGAVPFQLLLFLIVFWIKNKYLSYEKIISDTICKITNVLIEYLPRRLPRGENENNNHHSNDFSQADILNVAATQLCSLITKKNII